MIYGGKKIVFSFFEGGVLNFLFYSVSIHCLHVVSVYN